MKTLSEAIFHQCNSISDREVETFLMPCGLGWGSPIARQIVQSALQPSIKLRSDGILATRRAKVDEVSDPLGSVAIAESDTDEGHSPLVSEVIEDVMRHPAVPPRADVLPTKTPIPQPGPLAATEFAPAPECVVDGLSMEKSTYDNHNEVEVRQRLAKKRREDDMEVTENGPRASIKENNFARNQNVESRATMVSHDTAGDASRSGSSSISKTRRQREKKGPAAIPEKSRKEKAAPNRTKASRGGKSREKAQRADDAPPSPSSTMSVSPRSTKTDMTTSPVITPHDLGRSRVLRSPPGLPPPPGFGGLGSSTAADPPTQSLLGPLELSALPYSAQDNTRSLSALLPSLDQSISLLDTMRSDSCTALDQLYSASSATDIAQNSTSLFNRIRATDERNLEISATTLNHESIASIDTNSHLRHLATVYPVRDDRSLKNGNRSITQRLDPGGGFDIMGFLDDLLEESGRDETEDGKESISSNDVVAAAPLLEDPWAFGRQSRAAAYGIFVESNLGEVKEDSGIVQASVADLPLEDGQSHASTLVFPLLTPNAFGNSAVSVFENDDEITPPSQDYSTGDFYAKLLGE